MESKTTKGDAAQNSVADVSSPRDSAPEQDLVWSWQFDPLMPERGVEITFGGKACAVTPTLNNASLLVERLNRHDALVTALSNFLLWEHSTPADTPPYGHNCRWCAQCVSRVRADARAALASVNEQARLSGDNDLT